MAHIHLHINYLAVAVGGIVIFILGGLWYSPLLFAKPWMRLMNMSEEQVKNNPDAKKAMPLLYFLALCCGMIISLGMAIVLGHIPPDHLTIGCGACCGAFFWAAFAMPTSFATSIFSMTPKALWMINSGYNLVSFTLVGILLAAWQ